MKNRLGMVCLAILLTACSKQQLYEAARQNYLRDCDQWEGAEHDRCRAQYRESYQEYERKRVDAVREQSAD